MGSNKRKAVEDLNHTKNFKKPVSAKDLVTHADGSLSRRTDLTLQLRKAIDTRTEAAKEIQTSWMSLLVAYEQAYSECAVKWQLKFQDPTGEKAEQSVFSWLQEQRGLMASEKGRNEYLQHIVWNVENMESVINFYISIQKQLGDLYARVYETAKDRGDPGRSMIMTLEQGAKQRIEDGEADREQVQMIGKKVMDILDPLGTAGDAMEVDT